MRAQTRWDNLNIAFANYRAYIATKEPRSSLSFVDLLYASNFKGGNSSIIDSSDTVNRRLQRYAVIVRSIEEAAFGSKSLCDLAKPELNAFISLGEKFINLPYSKDTAIRGFRASYASAVLAAHFPDLAPVLDRYLLRAAKVKHETNKQGQVEQIQSKYGTLVRRMHKLAQLKRNRGKALREIDRELFVTGAMASE